MGQGDTPFTPRPLSHWIACSFSLKPHLGFRYSFFFFIIVRGIPSMVESFKTLLTGQQPCPGVTSIYQQWLTAVFASSQWHKNNGDVSQVAYDPVP